MKNYAKAEIEDLVDQFTKMTLPKAEWNHEAHILVAIWHNVNHDFAKALNLVRQKIKAYNEAVGTLNTEDAGYHETLTIFWMILTRNYVSEHSDLEEQEIVNNFLSSNEYQVEAPFKYFSKEVLLSSKARSTWINGDLVQIKLKPHKKDNHFSLSDAEFISKFEDFSLAPAMFSHEAHLRLSWLDIKKYGTERAIEVVSKQITGYAKHYKAKNKFNKTVTVASVRIVSQLMDRSNSDNFFDFALEFPSLKTNFKGLISSYYSFDVFDSIKAKREYLEPDLLSFE